MEQVAQKSSQEDQLNTLSELRFLSTFCLSPPRQTSNLNRNYDFKKLKSVFKGEAFQHRIFFTIFSQASRNFPSEIHRLLAAELDRSEEVLHGIGTQSGCGHRKECL